MWDESWRCGAVDIYTYTRECYLEVFFISLLWSPANSPSALSEILKKQRMPVFNREDKFYVKSGLLQSFRNASRLREAAAQHFWAICIDLKGRSLHWPVFSAIIPLPWHDPLEFCFVWEFLIPLFVTDQKLSGILDAFGCGPFDGSCCLPERTCPRISQITTHSLPIPPNFMWQAYSQAFQLLSLGD